MTEPGALGDLPPDEMRALLHRMADWMASYREGIEDRRIVPTVAPGAIASQLPSLLPLDAASMDTILQDLDRVVMPGVVHWGHPAFLGYFGSTSNGPALLGEMAAATLNVSAMTWATSPAATELESRVVEWIRELVTLPGAFTGIVYDTASVGLAHALAVARSRAVPGARAEGMRGAPRLVVYASSEAHSSVEKAMILLGLGEGNVVRVGVDDAMRMDVAALRSAMQRDVTDGARPMAVVATVGTTSTASVDDVRAIAELCREHAAWLHVDAAYGGAMAVLPEGRWVMEGAGLADSVIVNPHKWMFVPLDFSVLFTRHAEELRAVFSIVPEYLEGDAAGGAAADYAVDYMDYGIQLGRRFRALKAWMALRALGRSGLESRIREHCRLAAVFAGWVRASEEFELAAPPSMGVVCFRARGEDALNEEIVRRVKASGRAYITHTRIHGRTCLRVGIGNIATTEVHLAGVWDAVRAGAVRTDSAD
ncbi:MAG: ddc 2 [Gemmatimonadetes bacterium]|nr:ddc 2 [Gemmatimonadota bacterium]